MPRSSQRGYLPLNLTFIPQIMFGHLRLGGTDSILGIFQIIKALEELLDWALVDFQEWYSTKVLY